MAIAIAGADTPAVDQEDCTVSSHQTELYFRKAGAAGDNDLFWMTRATSSDPWTQPAVAVPNVNTTPASEESPRLSIDDLTLYFGRGGDIYMAQRAATTDPWGTPTAVTEVNTTAYEKWMATSQGNYFIVSRSVSRGTTSDQDLFVGKLDGTDPGTLAAELSLPTYNEISSYLSPDCLTVLFASNRSGKTEIYTATRPDPTSPFGPVTVYDYWGTASDNEDAWMSADQRTIVFASIRNGDTQKAVYYSTR
jgi:hypothetical protein